MPITTTPVQRLHRLIREGARLTALCPGQTSIDVTPDIIALLDGINHQDEVPPAGLTRRPGHESSHKSE